MSVTPSQFVKIWNQAASMGEVEQLSGMKKSAAQSRAAAYRRKGVPLRKFHNSPRIDWAALAFEAETWSITEEDSETEES
jgi:hypothetical protein